MKMWDGRFSKPSDRLMEEFNNSLPVDRALIEEDIAGSIAWAKALEKAGVISADECTQIGSGLSAILTDYRAGTISFKSNDEDIHMAVERLLSERIGEAGARLHSGRSRNDQVATDFRLHVLNRMRAVAGFIEGLQGALLARAEADRAIIIPGFTHLQQAQPLSLAHYWLSFFWLLEREKTRALNAAAGADRMPLGSGAIAGAGFPVDRDLLAAELGFSSITDNSMDGVAARDFVLEALSSIASLGISLSRYAEDLIIWSSREFGFVELDDAWSTGSSMMPQKKNPDSLELIRGKSGRFVGNWTRFATTLKGVGLSYYKDLQEDKEPFIDSVTHIKMVLEVFTQVIATLTVKRERIAADLEPLLLATDLADYLVAKNLPFRQAHHVVGRIVGYAVETSTPLDTIPLDKLREYSDLITADVAEIFSYEAALAHRDLPGGTGPKSVAAQIAKARTILSQSCIKEA